jgi:hypothetical protein
MARQPEDDTDIQPLTARSLLCVPGGPVVGATVGGSPSCHSNCPKFNDSAAECYCDTIYELEAQDEGGPT